MKLPAGKIELCVSDDKTRPNLQNVLLDVKGKRLVATDGKYLAVAPVEVEEGDTDGYIGPKQLVKARKLAGRREGTLALNGDVKFQDGSTEPRPDSAPVFPPVDAIIDSAIPAKDTEATIMLDAEKLFELAKAVRGDSRNGYLVKLYVKDGTSAIYVKGNTDAFGLLMPVTSV